MLEFFNKKSYLLILLLLLCNIYKKTSLCENMYFFCECKQLKNFKTFAIVRIERGIHFKFIFSALPVFIWGLVFARRLMSRPQHIINCAFAEAALRKLLWFRPLGHQNRKTVAVKLTICNWIAIIHRRQVNFVCNYAQPYLVLDLNRAKSLVFHDL